MKLQYNTFLLPILFAFSSCTESEYVKIAVTTDVHGMIYPVDMIETKPSDHSLSHVSSYLNHQRSKPDTALILLDNGDFLQGQPAVYYFNTLKRGTPHISAEVMNYMEYDAATIGNHDIETGPDVYMEVEKALNFPWMAANAVSIHTGQPAFEPYTIIRKGGRKIAVLGLVTPGIPNWLPPSLWPDLQFDDMILTAEKWMPVIKREDPDLIIGLFHSGTDPGYGGQNPDDQYNENATLLVARQVPGFDIIFAGHDHRVSNQWIVNTSGDSVLVIDPGSHARYIGEAVIDFRLDKPAISGRIINVPGYKPDPGFISHFESSYTEISRYLEDTVTTLLSPMYSRDGLFGPSSFITLIHNVQLEKSKADISFTAPLAYNAVLESGPVLVSDMFKLYRFENMLYTMKLTGEEIRGFLEYAASGWFNTMKNENDHLLLFDDENPGRLKNPYYNFSSAAGINYSIDLLKEPGQKVTIHQNNGEQFNLTDTFTVAVNSYRGNGGGGHLVKGSGIAKNELPGRIIQSTQIDLRHHLMQYLQGNITYLPDTLQNWKLLPVPWYRKGEEFDRKMLFN